jgi:hypothetical protein
MTLTLAAGKLYLKLLSKKAFKSKTFQRLANFTNGTVATVVVIAGTAYVVYELMQEEDEEEDEVKEEKADMIEAKDVLSTS